MEPESPTLDMEKAKTYSRPNLSNATVNALKNAAEGLEYQAKTFQQQKYWMVAAYTWSAAADIYQEANLLDEAIAALKKAANDFQQMGNGMKAAFARIRIVELYQRANQSDEAVVALLNAANTLEIDAEALKLLGKWEDVIITWECVAKLYQELGMLNDAEIAFNNAKNTREYCSLG